MVMIKPKMILLFLSFFGFPLIKDAYQTPWNPTIRHKLNA